MNRIGMLFTLSVLSLIMIGCTSSGTFPYPSNRVPYPAGQAVSIRPAVDAQSGAIIGKLNNAITNQPASGVTIHLGKLVLLSPGSGHLINLDLASSPRAIVKADGSFAFEKIEPGDYGLLLWTPHQTEQVQYSDNPDKELIIVVEAGKVNDLGTVKVIIP